MFISISFYPFLSDDLASISTGEIPSADIIELIVKYKMLCNIAK